jgi:hypothetical protein
MGPRNPSPKRQCQRTEKTMTPKRFKLPDTMSMAQTQALAEVTAALDAAGIDYALIGGLAVGVHGHPRATKDIDFLVSRQAERLIRGRSLGGGEVEGVTEKWNGVPVDFLFPAEVFLEEFIPGAISADGVRTLPVNPLIYMKLVASRRRDQDDVVRLVRAGKVDVPSCRAFLEEHAPRLVDDFDSLVAESSLTDS